MNDESRVAGSAERDRGANDGPKPGHPTVGVVGPGYVGEALESRGFLVWRL